MEKNTSRIEAFSDGVFGVAITLLAIDIGVEINGIQAHHPIETTTNNELLQQLTALWPKIFTYFNSFASVLLMWMAHHRIFKMLRTVSNRLILTNGLLLLIIALAPLPTKTLGQFIFSPAFKTAVIFYTGYSVLVAVTYVAFMAAAKSRGGSMFMPEVPVEEIEAMDKGLWKGFLLNSLIFAIAFFIPLVALILNFCMWIFWAIMSGERKKEMV